MSYHGTTVLHPLTPEEPDAARYIVCLRCCCLVLADPTNDDVPRFTTQRGRFIL